MTGPFAGLLRQQRTTAGPVTIFDGRVRDRQPKDQGVVKVVTDHPADSAEPPIRPLCFL